VQNSRHKPHAVKDSPKSCTVASGTHQPNNTLAHLTVAIWSSAWCPLPDSIAVRFFQILCVFGGFFPALRFAVVSVTGIS